MNKDLDFNSKKYTIMLIAVLLVFFVLIIKAFEYLPENIEEKNDAAIVQVNKFSEDVNSNQEDVVQDENKEQSVQKKSGTFVFEEETAKEPKITEINNVSEGVINETPVVTEHNSHEQAQIILSPEEKAFKAILRAQAYKQEKSYNQAIEEYKAVSTLTNDKDLVAKSYEEISTIYAIARKYGSALSYAQRANSIKSTPSNELLLARIYYKTGSIDKALGMVNNILKREFALDK